MSFSKQQFEEMAAAVPFWFHSIRLGEGVVTKGWKSEESMAIELERLALPDLHGKTVLDINSWDGFFAFEAERRGASRVVALDEYMWAMDLAEHRKYWLECAERGVSPAPYHTMPYYKPAELPGKVGFDTAHKALQSCVEVVVGDFMELNLDHLEADVVLYLGSLYHMENPMLALRRLAQVTRELAIIETEAAEFPHAGDHALFEFFGANELNGDVSNWWAPNEKGLTSMCRAAGFEEVKVIVGSPLKAGLGASQKPIGARLRSLVGHEIRRFTKKPQAPDLEQVIRYRAVVHARKTKGVQ
jgi:tRNA (mo5U34)-methyltransferase